MSEKLNDNQNMQISSLNTEDKKLIDNSEQLIKDFRQLDSEIKFSAKNLQNQFNDIQAQIKKWSEGAAAFTTILDEKLVILSRETTVLCTLPVKIEEHLNQLVPKLGAEVQKKLFADYEIALSNCNKQLNSLSEKISLATKKMTELDSAKFRKKLKLFIITLMITILASASTTYTMLQYFPQKVTIDTNGDINIDGGNVSAWSATRNKVQIKKKN